MIYTMSNPLSPTTLARTTMSSVTPVRTAIMLINHPNNVFVMSVYLQLKNITCETMHMLSEKDVAIPLPKKPLSINSERGGS